VWDSSIVQGPFSVAPCQTLTIRFATLCIAVRTTCFRCDAPPELSRPFRRLQVDEEELLEKMESALTAEEAEAKLIEERRAKRAAILAKHKAAEAHTAAVVAPTATEVSNALAAAQPAVEEEDADDEEDMNVDFTAQLQKEKSEAADDTAGGGEAEAGDMFGDDMFDENSPVAVRCCAVRLRTHRVAFASACLTQRRKVANRWGFFARATENGPLNKGQIPTFAS
jgi:hypothetical protein